MPIFSLRRPLRGYIFSALLCSALAAGLTSASGSAMAASEMQELAATLHAAEFSPRVDQLLKAGHPAQALELADLGLEKNPRSAQLRFSRTVALERLGRTEEAAKALRSLIAEYPEIPEPYNNLPVVTFVDTPGAYPGIDAEQRGQSEAIGRNLFEMAGLKVPVLTCIIGEGGSGGALALAVADMVMMLQYATYSVISPEGCASILWKDAAQAPRAAEALALTADRLSQFGLVDRVISEPLGGAHRDPKLMATSLRQVLIDELRALLKLPLNTLMERRSERLRRMGDFEVVGEPATAAKSDEVEDAHEVNAAK